MNDILKAILAGKFTEQGDAPDTREYKEALRKQIICSEKLREHMSQEAKTLWEEYTLAFFEVQEQIGLNMFRRGFLLGIGIQKEIDRWTADDEV